MTTNPPVLLRATGATKTTLLVAWRRPESGTQPTGYDVRITPIGGTTGDPIDVGMATSHSFGSLTPNTPYEISARSVSSEGTSAWASIEVSTVSFLREHFYRPVRDAAGALMVGSTVAVYKAGSTEPLPTPLYVSPTGDTERGPAWVMNEGVVDFYLDMPQVVDIAIFTPGRAEASVLYQQWVGDILDVDLTNDTVMATIDADPNSQFRTQQDARLVDQIISTLADDDLVVAAAVDAVAGALDPSSDLGNVTGALEVVAGRREFTMTGDTSVTVLGSEATLYVHGTGQALTIAGETFVIDGEQIVVYTTFPGSGRKAAFSAGASRVPDSTPPSAITDFVATGGEEQITLTFTYPTDAESTPHVGYKVWLTSDTEPSTFDTTATASPIVLTGLPSGDYSAKIYAYSAGGSTVAATATATVTAIPGWSVIVADTFAGDGALVGRTTTTGSKTWASVNAGSSSMLTTGGLLSRTYDSVEFESKAEFVLASAPSAVRYTFADYNYGGGAGIDMRLTYVENGTVVRGLSIGLSPTLYVNDSGGAPMTLSGDTTGWLGTGTAVITIVGSAFSITDGTRTATGTLAGGGAGTKPGATYGVNMAGTGTQTLGSITVEIQ